MLGHFRTLLEGLARGQARTIADLAMFREDERVSLAAGEADGFNGFDIPAGLSISQLDRLSAEEIDAYLLELRGSMEGDPA